MSLFTARCAKTQFIANLALFSGNRDGVSAANASRLRIKDNSIHRWTVQSLLWLSKRQRLGVKTTRTVLRLSHWLLLKNMRNFSANSNLASSVVGPSSTKKSAWRPISCFTVKRATLFVNSVKLQWQGVNCSRLTSAMLSIHSKNTWSSESKSLMLVLYSRINDLWCSASSVTTFSEKHCGANNAW